MLQSLVILSLAIAQQVPAAGQAKGPTKAPPTAEVRVVVTDRSGAPLEASDVTAEGPSSRQGLTSASGDLTFRTMTAGTYRIRAERDGFITLEKEVAVRGGAATPVELSLSPAPPAPPPPQPLPAAPLPPPTPAPVAGQPRTVSIPDLAERALRGRDPLQRVPIGCSGVGSARLIQLQESLTAGAQPEVDEMMYVVAGTGTLQIGALQEQAITPGWFGIVPRGTPYVVARKGRNPIILLSIEAGARCDADPR